MSDVRKLFDDPHTVTRDEILEQFAAYRGGSYSLCAAICGLLLDVAALRGFDPFTEEEIRAKRVQQQERSEQYRAAKQEALKKESELWLQYSLDEFRALILKDGIRKAERRLPKILRKAPLREHGNTFKAKAEQMLDEASEQAILSSTS